MRIFLFFGVVAASISALAACAGVADLEVKYNPDGGTATTQNNPNGPDATLAPDASPVHVEAPSDAGAPVTPPAIISTCGAGPDGGCDISQGFGCCLSGGATCMSQADYATACPSQATFVGCFQPSADAECCWHTINGSRVALAGSICSEGYACLVDNDCPEGTGSCQTASCHGVTIGQCGVAPTCP